MIFPVEILLFLRRKYIADSNHSDRQIVGHRICIGKSRIMQTKRAVKKIRFYRRRVRKQTTDPDETVRRFRTKRK